ncbi:hypothetical protein PCANC_24240 [Puccinia coronata f. sp. avenae]|uniref:DDE Tnp4 domain-containing protein n=1 Tax=Puccinia coronata f. sp. avenae TaxID=200324 RepID=A0A2N5SFD3_9BASI|nr:hypothetical protein PCANC_24240 [Puccinia coronata f. sp. avenae]
MRKISERQFAIRELFMMLVLLQLEETDCLVDAALNLPSIPTLGSIISPNDASKQLIFDLEFEDSARVADLLRYVLSNRYLHDRLPARTRDEFNLGQLFDMRDNDFKQAQQLSISASHPSPASLDVGTDWLKWKRGFEATDVTSVAQTDFMSAGPTDTLEQRHNPRGVVTDTTPLAVMKEIIRWISACVILHNLLAHLGNAWEDLDDEIGSPEQQSSSESISASSEDFCDNVQEKCIQYNYAVGTLPIQL